MKLKKATALFIVLAVLLSMVLTDSFAENWSATEKADTLYKFNILKGNGVDFNLDGQLLRSEAATFIVRLMGKEKDVLADSNKWSVTSYKDVQESAWYAPYIGYCSQLGIIGGFPDGTYRPNDNISEKAFLKLVLGVLGYKYNTHFNWTNVLRKAYDVGLVYDPNYQYKNKDNTNYKRSSVVDVLYNSLDRVNRETKVKVVDNLLELGIIDRAVAVEEGFIEDKIITEISDISVIDINTIKVKFNENVKALTADSIEIHESKNESAILTVSIKLQSSDEITLTTSAQVPNKEYTVKISGVMDSEGNKNNVISSFTGYQNIEVNSDFFRIHKIEAVSKNVINVFFTQPINMNVELPLYYDVLQGTSTYIKGSFNSASIKVLAPYDNAVSIFFKEKDLQEGAVYTLKLNGELTSAYSVKLNDGNGDSMSFTASGAANEGFYIINVMPLNKKYVKIQFNKDIDISSAQLNTNYTFKDSDGIPGVAIRAIATQEGLMKNKEVILEVAPQLDSAKKYDLYVSNVYDSFRQIQVEANSKYPFPGVSTSVEDLKIVNVHANDKGTLSVFFNKPLNVTEAVNTLRYTVSGVGNPSAVYFDSAVNPYMVKLYFNADAVAAPTNYTLTVDRFMRDYLGEISSNDTTMGFTGSTSENIKPFMVEAKTISSDTIKVTFNEEISPMGFNTMPSNYSLEYKDGSSTVKKSPTSVSYLNATTMLMKFNSIDFSKQYVLKFTTALTDYNGVNRLLADGLDGISVYLGQ